MECEWGFQVGLIWIMLLNIMTKLKFKPALLLSLSVLAILPACATSLASRTPIDIASNSVRHTDPLSGVSEILAPRVKVFDTSRSNIGGNAQLRTAGAFTDKNGLVLRGGSYLDILINYTTATPQPEEARQYDTVSWAGGTEALLADFGMSVLDCRQDIRENYIPSYPYGYSNYGYGYSGGYGGYGRGYRPRGYGYDDHGRDHGPKHEPRDKGNPKMKPMPNKPMPNMGKPKPPRPDDEARDRPPRRKGYPRIRPDSRIDPDDLDQARRQRPTRANTYTPAVRPPRPARPSAANAPTLPKPVASTPRPVQKAPAISRPRPAPKPRPTPKPRPQNKSKPGRPEIKDIFQREHNYYPGDPYYDGGIRDISVSYRCVREESLRIFIPKDRLNIAEQRGLVLYLRPQTGREEALFLPPNYITGFKMAAYSPEGAGLAIQGAPVDFSKPATRTQNPVPAPRTNP